MVVAYFVGHPVHKNDKNGQLRNELKTYSKLSMYNSNK